jgi:ornithine cyclodeaminase
MKIVTEKTLTELIKRHGYDHFITDLTKTLKQDYSRWQEFNKVPRPAMHVTDGVIELMPICDDTYYSFKYVNCHPKNYDIGLMTVVATGQLARIDTGYPLLFSEMTLLTALRTAATTAIATDLMARKDSTILAIIGTGAQSDFLVRAICQVRNITEIRFFDIDSLAMAKFEKNSQHLGCTLVQCQSAEEAVRGADIVTTCTACRAHVDVIKNEWITPGMHINGIGGDSEGKTELEASILSRCQIVVEYLDQCKIEGEIQRLTKAEINTRVTAELHELITNKKVCRVNDNQITLYDSVGIALEDYSALRLTYELCNKYELGQDMNLTPNLSDAKNLISMVM